MRIDLFLGTDAIMKRVAFWVDQGANKLLPRNGTVGLHYFANISFDKVMLMGYVDIPWHWLIIFLYSMKLFHALV